MSFVKVDPPGTVCAQSAVLDAIRGRQLATFIDIGCGSATFSKILCKIGLSGTGLDFSDNAIAVARSVMAAHISSGKYTLVNTALENAQLAPADLVISYMVLEHIEDDVEFLRRARSLVRPGGLMIIGVPGRHDHWSAEDETVGHYRRYERDELFVIMRNAGLLRVDVWSVAVPVANILFKVGIWLLKNTEESAKRDLSKEAQTKLSGLQEIRWKTVFPRWVGVFVNRRTLYPIIALQRLFYRSSLGITLMAIGEV